MEKISIITLGCSKNTVDSEVLITQLEATGYTVEHNPDNIYEGIVIINTCGFIGDAKEESVNVILEVLSLKQCGRASKVVVFGCLSQRYPNELLAEMPNVDAYFGAEQLPEIVSYFGGEFNDDLIVERANTTANHYAYVKISEGCNWGCSYCAIPLIRGKHRSRKLEEIVREVEILATKGVKEIILIAQDLTYYGKELYGERRLAQLLEALCVIDGVEWIRLHYAYPTSFPMEVIDVMKRNDKICKYLDIPLQHVNDRILRSMKRGTNGKECEELIATLRKEIPSIVIRTTMIVGYPGETDEEFNELVEFVKRVDIDRLGVFAYSEEEGTAAAELEDNVPYEVKQHRVEELMAIQQDKSYYSNAQLVGSCQRVLIDRCEDDYFVGRMESDSPEVDNEVIVYSDEQLLTIGEFYRVNITEADNFEIIGDVIL